MGRRYLVLKYHSMEAYGRVEVKLHSFLALGKESPYPLVKKLGEPQNLYERNGE
jgi:hypothetical protein